MYKKNAACIIFLLIAFSSFAQRSELIFENKFVYIELKDDLNGFNKIIDKKTGRNYASGNDASLFTLRFGKDYTDTANLFNSAMASNRRSVKLKDGLEWHYKYEGAISFDVVCKISGEENSSLIKWSIKIDNRSTAILTTIKYPQILCTSVLGEKDADDGVVFPIYEGVLLTGMNKAGAESKNNYPGSLSSQMMYYFDPAGGFYYASHDGNGYKKSMETTNTGNGILFAQEYFLPIEHKKEIELPYPVVTGFSGGRWEAGASIYRDWAEQQPWCAKTLAQRDPPEWLKKSNLFINFGYALPDWDPSHKYFSSVDSADLTIKKYHDYFNVSIIACGWDWEKNGIWMGPDYFPPVHGDSHYAAIAEKVKPRGDHLQLYTSGFRWGVKKPLTEKKDENRFTDYDGAADFFMKYAKQIGVVDYKGELLLEKRYWAHNYFLCPGSKSAQKLLESCFEHIYKWGVEGVDLDQDLGGAVENCFAANHGHPIGAGVWQYRAMHDFLSKTRLIAHQISKDNFVGLEEPGELFIPQVDAVDRNFMVTGWPVWGPGAVSIPLYLYLYHPYQIAYTGWINMGRAPFGIEKNSIGRTFLFGMYPGISMRGSYDLVKQEPNDDLKMLKGFIELVKKNPEYLIHGKMLGEIDIKGGDSLDIVGEKKETFSKSWKTVQGIAWFVQKG
jgi:hypothetical protein